jgi:hypothetical protein
VLVTPAPDAGTPLSQALAARVRAGGGVLLYGPVTRAGADLLEMLNLQCADPIAGELSVHLHINPDRIQDGDYPTALLHDPMFSAGGYDAIAGPTQDEGSVIATVSHDSAARVAAVVRRLPEWHGGQIAWVRGTNSSSYRGGHLLTSHDPARYFAGDLLMRFALAELGYDFAVDRKLPAQRGPIATVSRHRNGFFFSGYTPDTTVGQRLRFPMGAPILIGMETELDGGHASIRMPRSWHRECRIFIDAQEAGIISCIERSPEHPEVSRRILVTGLEQATLRFYPEPGAENKVRMLRNPAHPYLSGEFLAARTVPHAAGAYLEVMNVNGPVLISW